MDKQMITMRHLHLSIWGPNYYKTQAVYTDCHFTGLILWYNYHITQYLTKDSKLLSVTHSMFIPVTKLMNFISQENPHITG